MKKLLWVIVIAFSLNAFSQSTAVKFLSAKVSSDGLKITMNFNKAIYGTNKGFTIYNTRSKTFNSVTGFGTKVLVGTLTNPVIYGEPVNISYKSIETLNNISGNLVDIDGINVGYFLKELVDTSAIIFTGIEKYVTATASGGGDGSISSPFTFEEMLEKIDIFISESTTGVRFNLKAGLYIKKEGSVYNKHGKAGKPVIIEGYTHKAGDNPNVGWDYDNNRNMNSDKMPLFDGQGSTSLGNPFTFSASSFISVKNLQFYDYANGSTKNAGVYFNNSNHIFIENCIVEKFDRGINIVGNTTTCFENVVSDCIVLNGYLFNFKVNGSNCLFNDNKSYADNSVGDVTDYYYSLVGNFNILRNNYGNRVDNIGHSGHGLSISTSSPGISNDSDTDATQYNFIDGHTSVNMGKQIEFRHGGVRYNVVRGLVAHGGAVGKKESGGIMFRDNASFNIVENAYINDTNTAIYFTESVEIGVGLGHDNIIRNSVFTNLKFGIRGENYNKGIGNGYNNKIYNCTFYNVESLFRLSQPDAKFSSNKLVNNIFYNIPVLSHDVISGWSYDNNNIFKSFEKPVGVSNISKDPKFKNATQGNFRLKPDSPLKDKGQDLEDVKNDFDGMPRPQGSSADIGAFEIIDNTTSSIKADAGSDQVICLGESVTLTASGGSTYSWNTGATTESIAVDPNETTTYTVTVSEGSASDSDTVTVAVSSVMADAGSDQTIENGQSVTLTASGGDSYVWDTGGTTQSIMVTPTATTIYTVTVKQGNCEDTDTVQITVNQNNDPTITANAGSDQAICLGESVTLTASGGSGYSWNTGARTKSITVDPNETTTYTVTVSDGGTSDSDQVTVAVSSVTANAGGDQVITEGDSVTLTASGGDSYLWSTGAISKSITVSPQETQNYTVTAKKGNCEDTDTVQVTVNQNNDPTITANAGSDQAICLGESVTLTASGGSGYSWNTGATTKSIMVDPNETTTYTVTVSEGSVSDSDTVTVAVSSVTAEAGSDKTMYEGESVTLTASGGESYLWSTGATSKSITVSPQETQNYTLTAYKNGCEDTDTVQVTVNKNDTSPPPAKANAGEDQTICLGDRAKLTASGGKTYVWSTGEITASIYVNPTRTTSYTVTATRGGVTNSDNIKVTVENCSVLSEEASGDELNIYPNPTEGTLHIEAGNTYDSLNLNIYSMNGSIVYSDKVQTKNNIAYKTVDLSNLTNGVYIVRMYNADYQKTKRVLLY